MEVYLTKVKILLHVRTITYNKLILTHPYIND